MPNIKNYADTAAKLSAWLSDPKAYYAVARPKVGPRGPIFTCQLMFF